MAQDYQTTEEFWGFFHSFLLLLERYYVPLTKVSNRPFTLPVRIRIIEGRKRYLFRRYGPQSRKFKKASAHLARFVHRYMCSLEEEFLENNDRTKLYTFVRRKFNAYRQIPDLTTAAGPAVSDREKSEVFAGHFKSVFTVDNGILPPIQPLTDVELSEADFTQLAVRKAIMSLAPKLTRGPDQLPAFFYRQLCNPISFPLTLLFQKSLHEGVLPSVWRQAVVVPVFKKGSRAEPTNYRPIAKQCTALKVMEKAVMASVVSHVEGLGLLSERQFGFRSGRSVTQQLLFSLTAWSQHFSSPVYVTFLDLMKAFDKVSHEKIIHKLSAYGINDPLLSWFRAYFHGRIQRVQVGCEYSSFYDVTSSINQGSCAGPLLFILFINDIVSVIPAGVEIGMFADDCTLFSRDAELLQKALDNVQDGLTFGNFLFQLENAFL